MANSSHRMPTNREIKCVREKLGPPGKRSDHSRGGEHMQGIDADRLPAADAACGVFDGAPLVAHGGGHCEGRILAPDRDRSWPKMRDEIETVVMFIIFYTQVLWIHKFTFQCAL